MPDTFDNPADAITSVKIDQMLAGRAVIMSDSQLDDAEQYHEIRSYSNPFRRGMNDRWICWIGDHKTWQEVQNILV